MLLVLPACQSGSSPVRLRQRIYEALTRKAVPSCSKAVTRGGLQTGSMQRSCWTAERQSLTGLCLSAASCKVLASGPHKDASHDEARSGKTQVVFPNADDVEPGRKDSSEFRWKR